MDGVEFFELFDAALDLFCLCSFISKSFYKSLFFCDELFLLCGGFFELCFEFFSTLEVVIVVPREHEEAVVVEGGDAVDDVVEEGAVVADDEQDAWISGQKGFEPGEGFEVEMVGGFVEQQKIGFGEE